MIYDNKTIFVQIASYRDPELPKTVKDCLYRSKNPYRLRIGICRQYSKDDKGFDDLSEFNYDNRFKIKNVDHKKSMGVCWARNKIQQLYNNEDYTLQLDSHHRFVDNWDEKLIYMLEDLKKDGYKKPLLTMYAPSYDPGNDPAGRLKFPCVLDYDKFAPEGPVFVKSSYLENFNNINKPIPSRFYSAHMCFGDGSFAKEVQHDPYLYFHGEEISIAARAYTHGYDLFHPHRVILWHQYTRKTSKKHWDDHDGKNKTFTWHKTNDKSYIRIRMLFEMDGLKRDDDEFGKYGFGKKRTLRDYEKYAGICFKNRGAQQYTIDKKIPPNPQVSDEDFEKSCSNISHGYWKAEALN